MMYGQTGSGKTHTMTSFYRRVADQLFPSAPPADPAAPAASSSTVTESDGGIRVTFVEVAGERVLDVLNGVQPVPLLACRDGGTQAHPLAEARITTAAQLVRLARRAAALRATAATASNSSSSRSHAVCRIYVPAAAGGGAEGLLQLVDLAGAEDSRDSAAHGAERRRESAQINTSLSMLKECMRARANAAAGPGPRSGPFRSAVVPYRKSKLTHLLRACFAPGAVTCIIATVSPASKAGPLARPPPP
jgi:kinesin family protein 2/24